MLVIRRSLAAIRNHDGLEIEHHRVARGGVAANIRLGAADKNCIDPLAEQNAFEVERTVRKCALAVLDDNRIVLVNDQIVPNLLVFERKSVDHIFLYVWTPDDT